MSELLPIRGRVVVLRRHKNSLFGQIDHYNSQTKLFESLNFSITRDCTQDYESLSEQIYLGACMQILNYRESKDLQNNRLIQIISSNILSKPYFFPHNFVKNQLKDKEIKHKNPILTYCTSPIDRNYILSYSKILGSLRRKLESKSYLEMPINVLEEDYGGAEADPFTTVCNYNKKTYFLRVCLEYPLKGLIVAGFPKVYHLGSVFRNEGLDSTHTPEFSLLEYYNSDTTLEQNIQFVQSLYRDLYYQINNTYVKNGFDLRNPWPIYDESYVTNITRERNCTVDDLMDNHEFGPFFHLKGFYHPLAKNPHRIESYCDYNTELIHMYLEQNDLKQLEEASDRSTTRISPWFLNIIKLGMLETVGCGIGIDRLVKSITGAQSIRQVQPYTLV